MLAKTCYNSYITAQNIKEEKKARLDTFVKKLYKIPYSLNVRLEDTEIPIPDILGGSDHIVKMRSALTVVGAIIIYVMFVRQFAWTWSSIIGGIIWTIGYIGIVYFGLREVDIPGLYGFNALTSALNYFISKRTGDDYVDTSVDGPYKPVSNFTGIAEPTDNGYIQFSNGDYGILFEITGTASNNTFQIDRETTIEQFSDFLRTMPFNTTVTFITTADSQNVEPEINYLHGIYNNERNPALKKLFGQQLLELMDLQDNNSYVSFISLHPYMLVRSTDVPSLDNAWKTIRSFIEQSGYVINSIKRPSPEDEMAFFRNFYTGFNDSDLKDLEKSFREEMHGRKSALASVRKVKKKPGKPKIIRRK